MDLGEPVLITAEGLEKAKVDLEATRERRREAADRMKEAAQPGDIEDNPEFEQAKEEVAQLDNRIYELEELIARAQLIRETHGSVAQAGSTVETTDSDGNVEEWHLVGAFEADPGSGRISIESPVGRALVGRRKGESVTVAAPSGELRLQVTNVS